MRGCCVIGERFTPTNCLCNDISNFFCHKVIMASPLYKAKYDFRINMKSVKALSYG